MNSKSSFAHVATYLQTHAHALLFSAGAVVAFLYAEHGVDYRNYSVSALHVLEGQFSQDDEGATNLEFRKRSWGVSAILAPFLTGSQIAECFGRAVFAGTAVYLLFVPLIWTGFLRTLNENQATVAILCLISGSPLGYYLTHVGADTLVLPALAGLWLYAIGYQSKYRWFDLIALGSLLALAGMTRIYLLPYGFPAVARMFLESRKFSQRIGVLAVSATGSLCAVGITAFQNYALTGSWNKSPYDFGDSLWRSIRLTESPFGWDALFSPYHGFIAFHPLCGVGLIACAVLPILCWRAGRKAEAMMWLAADIAIAVNIWFVGSFYFWTMVSPFGTRGLLPLIFPAAFALARCFSLGIVRGQVFAVSIFVGVAWSILLMTHGDYMSIKSALHDFSSYRELIAAVVAGIPMWADSPRLLALALLVPVNVLLWHDAPQRMLLIPLVSITFAFYLATPGKFIPVVYYLGIYMVPLVIAGISYLLQRLAIKTSVFLISLQICQCIVALVLLGRLALETKVVVLDPGRIQYTSDVEDAAKRFERIPQYRQHAEEIRAFLERNPGK